VRPDGTILFNKRKQFISTSLAGEFIGLQSLDDRYVQVLYANVMLGFIDAQRAEYGLVRPKVHQRNVHTTKRDVQRAPSTTGQRAKRKSASKKPATRVTKARRR
jgi:hypothetical protein